MGPLDHLGVSATELEELLGGGVWVRWQVAEPALAGIGSLKELRALRGFDANEGLGALVRLAAVDGGDDKLAAVAVAHQLAIPVRRLAFDLRDLSLNADALVMSALWEAIRTFPWRRRTRAFATGMLRATRTAVLDQLIPPPWERRRIVLVEPVLLTAMPLLDLSDATPPTTARGELGEYLAWCRATRWITAAESALLMELVVAGWQTKDVGLLKLRRGACSLHAVQVVADRRGISAKTLVRERDRILEVLRIAAVAYLREVA